MQIYSDKLFKNPIDIIELKGDITPAFEKIEFYQQAGKYLLGFVTYDFNYIYFEVFDGYEEYLPKNPKQLGIVKTSLVSKEEYISAIEKIKEYIKNGVTYEVNYTYPLNVKTGLDGFDLYEALLPRQKTPYNTFLQTKNINLLSYSPELFFRLEGNKIVTKPMKGTIQRGKNSVEDKKMRDFLFNDPKNRAENIMIIDLLRNDLGRIAQVGSVKVEKLFEIEEHPTLFQMTGEVHARLREDVKLLDIFKAIFPCGSITGAPKKSTMRVIDELEPFERNIYCGAIGFITPEFCEFSVPIRILYGKNYNYKYHVGGAIVWDSEAEDEWQETLTKTKFLESNFSLIETAVDDWTVHAERMKKSAMTWGFDWNTEIEKLEIPDGKILRVLLHKNGTFNVEHKELPSRKSSKVRIKGCVNSNNIFLYHKTSIRESAPKDVFDNIRVNERGEITEGTFTNIAVQKDGKLYTPPVSAGLLNGTYRTKLLQAGKLFERTLKPQDLLNADKIFCFNSVRKMVEVELC